MCVARAASGGIIPRTPARERARPWCNGPSGVHQAVSSTLPVSAATPVHEPAPSAGHAGPPGRPHPRRPALCLPMHQLRRTSRGSAALALAGFVHTGQGQDTSRTCQYRRMHRTQNLRKETELVHAHARGRAYSLGGAQKQVAHVPLGCEPPAGPPRALARARLPPWQGWDRGPAHAVGKSHSAPPARCCILSGIAPGK